MTPFDEQAATEKLRIERATERRLLIARIWADFSRVRELSAILDEPCPSFGVEVDDGQQEERR
jgi:hypothetical protein